MALESETLYWLYIVQLVCSAVSATLNISTLSYEIRKKERNVQLCMLFVHIVIHIMLALTAFLHSGHMLYAIHHMHGRHELVFWFGNLTYSFSVISGLSDFLLGLDRYVAMKMPIKYNVYLGRKLAIFAFLVCVALSSVNFVMMIFNRLPGDDAMITFGMHVTMSSLYVHNVVNEVFAILNIVVTVMFLWAYRQFNRKVNTNAFGINNQSTLTKVNVIVINQIVVETLFVIVPVMVTSIAQIGFNENWPSEVGPYPSSFLMLYIMICSILYRIKLSPQQDSSTEHVATDKVEMQKPSSARVKKVTFVLP
ncbi:hypothetical protein QR680_013933 [Steinernema hermaphroditum]|uniref:Uncharacterized protein n=1 Tax=Steinernema hermaphroditum TaxID=289476 RepID=A0AA39I9X7_9BILA|nr:hypothetical protein QR680_013933 [Steinernema hermaphroditum]